MPRKSDPEKDRYAKILLYQGKSIARIRQELKEIFGTSISPNRLLKLREEIKNQENSRIGEQKIPIPFLIKEEDDINKTKKMDEILERTTQNTIIIQKLWKTMKEFQGFIHFITPIIQELNYELKDIKKLSNENKDDLSHAISDELLIHEIEKRKGLIFNVLSSLKNSTIEELAKKTGIGENLVRWAIYDLTGLNVVKIEKIDGIEYIKIIQD